MPLLEVKNLNVQFQSGRKWLPAATDVSFTLERGEMLALVGESGCGKSVTCMSLVRLTPEPPAKTTGEILLNGRDILSLSPRELRRVRGGKIAYVFQEPSVSLNPVFRVGAQIEEAIRLHRPEVRDPRKEVVELLRQVGIPDPESRARLYPHEMSGGMQQRVMIAVALACNPEILVADEPTTALDVTIQAQILELLRTLREERNMAVILVSHNLGIVSELADRVAVMYAGRIIETADVRTLIDAPAHPYTSALIRAVPALGSDRGRLETIPGSVPPPERFGRGCRFFGRCAVADARCGQDRERCAEQVPAMREIAPGHFCACHFVQEASR